MKPIELRCHHIDGLIKYRHKRRLSEALAVLYSKECVEKTAEIYKNILKGDAPVTVTDDYDDICATCDNKKKVEGGCLFAGRFIPA